MIEINRKRNWNRKSESKKEWMSKRVALKTFRKGGGLIYLPIKRQAILYTVESTYIDIKYKGIKIEIKTNLL